MDELEAAKSNIQHTISKDIQTGATCHIRQDKIHTQISKILQARSRTVHQEPGSARVAASTQHCHGAQQRPQPLAQPASVAEAAQPARRRQPSDPGARQSRAKGPAGGVRVHLQGQGTSFCGLGGVHVFVLTIEGHADIQVQGDIPVV